MESAIVREMKLSDIDSVVDIEKKSFPIPWTKGTFISEIKRNKLARYYVAEVGGRVVGYAGMWLIMNEAHITNIAIHPEYRGMGIGKKLVGGLIEEVLKIDIYRITLEVRPSNTAARALYKKFGFVPCGIRPEYYRDNNEDAIIMWGEFIKNDSEF